MLYHLPNYRGKYVTNQNNQHKKYQQKKTHVCGQRREGAWKVSAACFNALYPYSLKRLKPYFRTSRKSKEANHFMVQISGMFYVYNAVYKQVKSSLYKRSRILGSNCQPWIYMKIRLLHYDINH